MSRLLPTLFLLFAMNSALVACSMFSKPEVPVENPLAGVDACFLLYNIRSGAFDHAIGEPRCRERFPAASSFKVPLAVMAFDSGALKDEHQVLKWDGTVDVRAEANRDHNAETWMRDSVVWFSQRLTPQMGAEKVQKYLDDFGYGNRDMTAGLTEAWLVRPNVEVGLKITAYEQVEFTKKLWLDELPVSKRAMRLTREITFLEMSPHGFSLSGKTGSNFYNDNRKQAFGWFVGHLSKANQQYIVVTNFNDLSDIENAGYGGPRAKEMTKKMLQNLGLW